MSAAPIRISRGGRASRGVLIGGVIAAFAIASLPWWLGIGAADRAVALLVYLLLAVSWNALAGYAGLVSIGQTAFFGLSAYAVIRLADAGVDPYLALAIVTTLVTALAWPLSRIMLSLSGGEFAIGMWVVSALAHLMVNLDPLIQGETGTSLIALNAYAFDARAATTLIVGVIATFGYLALLVAVLRRPTGAAISAIGDDEIAARSVGVDVLRAKRIVFVLAAAGAAAAGALWLASATTFQPRAYFGVHWTAYMIFMVLVGGLGRIEGAVIGAIVFFTIETLFGATGAWYLVGLGVTAIGFALLLPRGIWGALGPRIGADLIPTGFRVLDIDKTKKRGGT